jgi:FdhD protein
MPALQPGYRIVKWDGSSAHSACDEVAEEAPLEIRVRGKSVCITMRTPGHDEELAAGFLVSEGIVRNGDDLLDIRHCPHDDERNKLNVILSPWVKFSHEHLTRHLFASSSCGICGKATIDAIYEQFEPIRSSTVFRAETILQMPHTMRSAQATFDRTGGLHAAAIFAADGKLLVLREDVGRHNAVDKAIGYCLQRQMFPIENHLLLVSGRCCFEIMQKALAAGISHVAAISAPSSLAVDFALESTQALIGFLRGERMNIYSGAQRIAFP